MPMIAVDTVISLLKTATKPIINKLMKLKKTIPKTVFHENFFVMCTSIFF